uniref:ATP-binding protein n=1 Tax=Lachnoclostridium phocaeense TaxID=1871021 RepID=UPI0026DCE575|nr:ATP-binding protein [Lachnoclostridium phocaeense]
MNDLERRLIEAVCENKLIDAKKIAKVILEQDNTQKNRHFVIRNLNMLNNSTMNFMELPADLMHILVMEDVSISFNERRYFLSAREEELADKLIRTDHAARRLQEMGIRYVNSTLLYGESGTGKTTFGRYLAYKMGLPFAYLNFSHAIDSYLGGTQKNISRAFDFVKERKCVFMLDELDAIGMSRDKKANEVGEMSRVVISLMQNLDSLHNDVILLGATNRPDILDPALARRFNFHHEVRRLTKQERCEMASRFLIDVGYPYAQDWLIELCEPDRTQSDLMGRMIDALVDHLSVAPSESQEVTN